jgi:hypothetical protein
MEFNAWHANRQTYAYAIAIATSGTRLNHILNQRRHNDPLARRPIMKTGRLSLYVIAVSGWSVFCAYALLIGALVVTVAWPFALLLPTLYPLAKGLVHAEDREFAAAARPTPAIEVPGTPPIDPWLVKELRMRSAGKDKIIGGLQDQLLMRDQSYLSQQRLITELQHTVRNLTDENTYLVRQIEQAGQEATNARNARQESHRRVRDAYAQGHADGRAEGVDPTRPVETFALAIDPGPLAHMVNVARESPLTPETVAAMPAGFDFTEDPYQGVPVPREEVHNG